ncbi:hypothetical protein OG758_15040 [Streptomyces sp. NBC_01474]|uniref:hypothetical protein n=1 Tax=unclassified Streptomyces TaxID=2593676 RepID=UPI002DDABAF1|nr:MULTISPECIES: hypothetical protein [unclassified Streptomyces]WSD95321.1 hypothetical protein OG758_15040 [Streptomyces sp. NBC_01474]
MPNLFKRRHTSQGRHTPNLRSIWLVAPLALIAVGLLAFALYQGADALLTSENTTKTPVDVQDVIKATVTVITLMGAVLAGVYAYRKQLLSEGDSHRADASQLAERYTTAAEQLGHEQAAVRLAGVYAMARLADDWPEQRQVCVDVLCAYLRMPYQPVQEASGFKHGEREVRLTIIKIIRNHLRNGGDQTSWSQCQFDFTGAIFDGGSFARASFQRPVSFESAKFVDGYIDFTLAEMKHSTFAKASFSGGSVRFGGTGFIAHAGAVPYSFEQADFCGSQVLFERLRSIDRVSFGDAHFRGGTVIFKGSHFAGNPENETVDDFLENEVTFERARFSDGAVKFISCDFGHLSVIFRNAEYSGGTVEFENLAIAPGAEIHWGPFPQ